MKPDDTKTDVALKLFFEAYQDLKLLGWIDIMYCPKDGSWFDAIEVGSTSVHNCQYQGTWPTGTWWIADAKDLWPSRPVLWRAR